MLTTSMLLVAGVLVGPPAPRDRLTVLQGWRGTQTRAQEESSPYPLLLLADALSTEVKSTRVGRGDINPVVEHGGPVGRVAWWSLCAWGLGWLDARLPRWARVGLRAVVAGVERQMVEDNLAATRRNRGKGR